jgi:hypothetical protein
MLWQLSNATDSQFWIVLINTPSFSAATWSILPGFLALSALFAFVTGRRLRRVSLSALARNERGAATAMDLVLVVPIFLFVMLLIFQWALLMKNTVIVHYAAFTAARSARVHLCPPPANADAARMRAFGGMACTDDRSRQEMAARYALIMASPFDPRLRCEASCNPPQAVVDALARGTGTEQNGLAWQNQARYAFDGPNVEVDAQVIPPGSARAGTPGEPAGKARVRFRHVLLPWMEWTFGNGRRGDGNAYTIIEGEVTLL